ncbi:CBS domain-containing protein [Candidatus Woesearchaeota archaeon]|nr:CBS domain-containing protein [Candidatus Woesearchaeota archaeon]
MDTGVVALLVKDAMHDVTLVQSGLSVADAAVLMDQKVIGSVLVEERGEIIGIVSERDILRKVVAKGLNASRMRIKDIMSSPVITIDAETELQDASEVMRENKIRRLIITEGGNVVGIITARDVAENIKYVFSRKLLQLDR